jgi:predicted Zn-dependent protease
MNGVFRAWSSLTLAALLAGGTAAAQPHTGSSSAAQLSAAETSTFAQGIDALKADRLDEAERAFRDVLRAGGDLSFVHHNLGVVLHQRRQPSAALAEFRAAIRLDPAYGPSHLLAGTSLLALGRPREAIVELQAAERLMPQEVQAPASLADAYERMGDIPRVVDALRRSRAIAPRDPVYAYRAGRAYLALAQWSVERLRAVNPRSARLHQLLARTYMEQGQTAGAILELQAAATSDPSAPEINLALAELYVQQNQLDKAAEALMRELAVAPGSRAALAVQAKIEQARGRNP